MKWFLFFVPGVIFLSACSAEVGGPSLIPDADLQQVPKPADESPPPECSPFYQDCPASQTCLDRRPERGNSYCVDNGAGFNHQSCRKATDCRRGLACFYLPDEGVSRCLDYCDSVHDNSYPFWECSRRAGQHWDDWGVPGYDALADVHLGVWKLLE